MDRSKVDTNYSATYLPPAVNQPSSEFLLGRLKSYWQSMGVTDPMQVVVLSKRALQHAYRLPEQPEIDPVARALIGASAVLDDWLIRSLNLQNNPGNLKAARAALLSGVMPGWPNMVLYPPGTDEHPLDALRLAIAKPTPELIPRAMPTQQIRLFSLFGLFRLLWRKICHT